MIDFFNAIDTKLFLYLNGLHHPWLDPVMVFLSKSYVPTVLIAFIFFTYGFRKFGKKIFLVFFFLLLSVGLSDSISSRIMKPGFERLRPCKQKELKPQVYTAGQKCWGGKYGFVSSHAANTFSAALFLFLIFGKFHKSFSLFFVFAGLVSYSRIYLAKHFPLDLFFGALLGMLCAWTCYKLLQLTEKKLSKDPQSF